ncbi:metallophosphoesterase family protein [Pseudovibrio ascidiaceicola]|uniref:metallophosphoesterase family protein n=1 Tax=Pseudovibrio ascidiaceicola TaxID=285279 RepID=UPI000D69E840|nr:metallophosphoesterase [Pseudovibrio ascidiaceicola]
MNTPNADLQNKISQIREQLQHLKTTDTKPKAVAGPSLNQALQASERMLFGELNKQGVLKSSPPQIDLEGGNIEFGLALYWIFNPPEEYADALAVIKEFLEWEAGGPLQAPLMEDYSTIRQQIELGTHVTSDGSILGFGKYEMADVRWTTCLAYVAYYKLFPSKKAPFNTTPAGIIDLAAGTSKDEISIAILGDWGTGDYTSDGGPAKAVMDAISKSTTIDNPDYIIHVGDVYYAGTQSSEEEDNLVKMWPADRFSNGKQTGTSFTLNSNHEMYDGANGYFNIALSAANTPFNEQQKASFFALKFGDWMMLGLDSAYYSSASTLFMDGTLGGSKSSVQKDWLQQVVGGRKGKDVILLTHHNAISFDGLKQEPLWNEVLTDLGGTPDYWYWGHVHLGVVYGDQLPAAKGPDGRFAKVRCSGNAAIPNGAPSGLDGKPNIDYYSHTSLKNKEPRVRNGFAVITLSLDGQIKERFYEVSDGSEEPVEVWKSSHQKTTV